MRQIQFRAKSVWNGEWVYGNFIHSKRFYGCGNEFRIHNMETGVESDVLPDSIGQFTGLLDKNGVKIWEGDIVACHYFKMILGENLGVSEVDAEITGVIEFDGLSLCLQNMVGKKWEDYTGYESGEGHCQIAYLHDVYDGSNSAEMSMAVIGNRWDIPELLTPQASKEGGEKI